MSMRRCRLPARTPSPTPPPRRTRAPMRAPVRWPATRPRTRDSAYPVYASEFSLTRFRQPHELSSRYVGGMRRAMARRTSSTDSLLVARRAVAVRESYNRGSHRLGGRGRGRENLQPGQRRLERVEAEAAERERLAVELLEVERRALARLRVRAGLKPDPLAQLVGRRLARPAEIAVELEAQHLVADPHVRAQELPGQFRVPGLALVPAGARGDRQLQVHAEVDDDPGGAQHLSVEHAEQVAGILQVAEFFHQPLGIQSPALAVPGDPAHQPAPAVELFALVDGLRDLQVVTGDALVEHGGDLAPGGELLDAVGHRPPHSAGPGEVLAWRGVVDPALAGRGDHALDPPGGRSEEHTSE